MINQQKILVNLVGIFLCLILSVCVDANPSKVTELRISQQVSPKANTSHFIFAINGPVNYQKFMLTNPDRFVLDINNAMLVTKLNQPGLVNTFVKQLRANRDKTGKLRIVFDLKQPVMPVGFVFPLNKKSQYELVVDLTAQTQAPFKLQNKTVMNEDSEEEAADEMQPATEVPLRTKAKIFQHEIVAPTPKRHRNIIVVIDPGHGGKDPGAAGPSGHREKNVVLAISKLLQRYINQQPGFRAELTRNGDYFIPLRQRLAIARHDKADMFVAIHADAFRNTTAHGASVFALSERGATSEAALWIASSENKSEQLGEVNLSDKDQLLKSVLINLSQNHTIAVSLKIGYALLDQLNRFADLHHGSVEQAAFVVLKSPDIPSLLVETGFLSNRDEERRLMNISYQKRIAYGLMLGIKDYFVNNKPFDK